MDGTGEVLRVPEVSVIIEINRMFIEASGEEFIGLTNLWYETSLEYILEAIQQRFFGEDLFSTIFHKAAALADRTIVHHVFCGANKRTGLLSCVVLLELNGYDMQIFDGERFDQNAIEVALAFQEHQLSFDAFVDWIRLRTVPLK